MTAHGEEQSTRARRVSRPGAAGPAGLWSTLAGLGFLYLAAQFVRNALGVIGGDIEAQLGLRATETAILAGVMLLAYGLAQIPAAMVLRWAGARRVLPAAGALLTLSLAGFALGDSYAELLFWRVMMGVATSPVLAASYSIYLGYGEARFAFLSGLQTGFGRAGVVASTIPLALAVAAAGWRDALLWAAAFAAMAAVAATVVVLRRRDGATARFDASAAAVVKSLAANRTMQAAVLFQGVNAGVGGAILGLWGGPWLAAAYGMEVRERGLMLFVMALAWALSAPAWGLVAARTARPVVWLLAAAGVTIALLTVGALWPLQVATAAAFLALLGASSGGYPVVLKLVREAAPPGDIVYVATVLTAGAMVGVFAVQLATGVLVDQFGGAPGSRPVEAYRAVFGLLAALLAAATALAWSVLRRDRPGA